MILMFESKFELGETIYLKTDEDQLPRIITAIVVRPANNMNYAIRYELSCVDATSWHVDIEMSKEKNYSLVKEDKE